MNLVQNCREAMQARIDVLELATSALAEFGTQHAREAAATESIRRAEKEILIAEIEAHTNTKAELAALRSQINEYSLRDAKRISDNMVCIFGPAESAGGQQGPENIAGALDRLHQSSRRILRGTPMICPQCDKPLDLSQPHDPGGRLGLLGITTSPCHLGCELVTFRLPVPGPVIHAPGDGQEYEDRMEQRRRDRRMGLAYRSVWGVRIANA